MQDQEYLDLRHQLSRPARPALDQIRYMLGAGAFEEAFLVVKREGDLPEFVLGFLNRIDPYKAPEQWAIDINLIVNYISEEVGE